MMKQLILLVFCYQYLGANCRSVEQRVNGDQRPIGIPQGFQLLQSQNQGAVVHQKCDRNAKIELSDTPVIIQIIGGAPTGNFCTPYQNDLECSWNINAPPNKGVRLELSYSIEPPPLGAGCPYDNDRLVITDSGGASLSGSNAAFCRRMEHPALVISTGQSIRVEFETDSVGGDCGFVLVAKIEEFPQPVFILPLGINAMQPEKMQDRKSAPRKSHRRKKRNVTPSGSCGGTLVTTPGQKLYIESPGYTSPGTYSDNLDCHWKIKTSVEGNVLNARVDTYELEYEPRCLYDVLEFYNGHSTTARKLVYFCGYGQSANYYNSNGRELLVRLKTDGSINRRGFKVVVFEESVSCGYDSFHCQDTHINKCIPLDKVCDGHDDCPNNRDEQNCKFPCGIPMVQQVGSKIVGGEEATAHAYPWQVSVQYKGRKLCGGTIIKRNWVLCAAHCVQGKAISDFTVKLGKHKIEETEAGERVLDVANIFDHSDFNKVLWRYDVAMFLLARPIQYTAKIIPVCLPPTKDFPIPVGTKLEASGWGTTKDTGARTILRRVTVPHLPPKDCSDWLGKLFKTELMMCAGYEEGKKDTCQGDSGGPLVWKKGGIYYQIGITSWGKGCAEYRHPGVYARTSALLSWIDKAIKKPLQRTVNAVAAYEQIITNAGYPREYDNLQDMQWEIVASKGKRIKYTFIEVDVEEEKDCTYDYVRYFTKNDDDVGKKLCGSVKGLVGYTTENIMVVTFHSDASVSARGFKMTYIEV